MAYQVAIEGLPGDKTFRSQLLTSLCLAGIFEGSDRTRALVYSALEKCVNEERELVTERLNTIEKTFDKYERLLDLERGRRRLAGIRNALSITTNTP